MNTTLSIIILYCLYLYEKDDKKIPHKLEQTSLCGILCQAKTYMA